MFEMVNFLFHISAFMVSSSRWGSDSDSGDDGCLEKVKLMMLASAGSARLSRARRPKEEQELGLDRSLCCCLPTPLILASGRSLLFPLVVQQPASPSIWPTVPSLRLGQSTNPGVSTWSVCVCS